MGKIFYVMGKSATGKDTIFNKIIETMDNESDINLKKIPIYTTRPPRIGEIEGIHYHFVDDQKCEKLLDEGKVIELRTYNRIQDTVKYFTVKDENINIATGNYIGLGTIDSFLQIKKYFNGKNVVPIYIEVEDEQRILRAIKRESEQNNKNKNFQEVCRRYIADENDFNIDKIKDAQISKSYINDDIVRCVDEIIKDIKLFCTENLE